MSTAVQPEKILKDLQKLWVDLGKEESTQNSTGVLRACAMTLIAALEESADAQATSETIANLVHQHPSRVISLRVAQRQDDQLEARVFAQCWMPFGRRQQICCEQIEITASQPRVVDLPKLVLGIMAPDLPVVLWIRSERLATDRSFQQLFPLADKIIIDSGEFENCTVAQQLIHDLTQQGRNVADLAWTRLTEIRETIAQMFDGNEARARLKGLRLAKIVYAGPERLEVRYLSAWLSSVLALKIQVEHAEDTGPFEIRSVRFEGEGLQAMMDLTDSMVSFQVNQLHRSVAMPKRSDCDLLREELSVLGTDTIFRRSSGTGSGL